MLQPVKLTDFLTLEIPPRTMLLDPILPERSLSMLYSPRGTGKSWLGLSIGLAVASGSHSCVGPCRGRVTSFTLMARCRWPNYNRGSPR